MIWVQSPCLFQLTTHSNTFSRFCAVNLDWAIDGEPDRLCGDGHCVRGYRRRGLSHHTEHHFTLCLSGGVWTQPSVHGTYLRCRFRLFQKHLPRGKCVLPPDRTLPCMYCPRLSLLAILSLLFEKVSIYIYINVVTCEVSSSAEPVEPSRITW